MPFAIKAELDAMMNGSFALHTFPKPHFRHQIDRALLEHASANRRFYPFSATAFENHRINSFPREQQRQHQTSWASSNDSNTCSHVHHQSPCKLLVEYPSCQAGCYRVSILPDSGGEFKTPLIVSLNSLH